MSVFPSPRHLASWVALCPGQNESAGKQKSGKTRQGNRWLRAALTEAALSAIRSSNTAFAARYRRLQRHRGHKKAVIAVAHSLSRHRVSPAHSSDDLPRGQWSARRSATRRSCHAPGCAGPGATRLSRHTGTRRMTVFSEQSSLTLHASPSVFTVKSLIWRTDGQACERAPPNTRSKTSQKTLARCSAGPARRRKAGWASVKQS